MSNRMADAIIGVAAIIVALLGVAAMVNFAAASDKGGACEVALLNGSSVGC